jgi:predicted Zn-ribbon and HTH transcriptional regulator
VKLVGTTSHMQYKDYVNELLGLVKEVMTTNKFTEEELEAAKIAGKTGLYALFDNFGDSESLFLHDWLQSSKIPLDKELEKFEAATLTEVQTVFNRYFGQEPTIITVGKLDSQPEQPEVEDNAEQLAAQTLDRPTPAGSHATQPNAVKPSYIPVPVRKEDEIQKPAGQAEQPTEIAEEPEIDSDIADDEDELAEDLGDNEINTNPLTESTCAGCGKPFQHLPGVNVKKCPDCKVADIEGTSKRTVEHVALYGLEHPDKTLGHSRLVTVIDDFTSTPLPASITMAGAKSEGKDYGSKASSQLKPASAPPIVPVGKKSEGGGGDSGTAGAEKAGGKDKFKPATGKGVVSSEGGEDSQAAEEAANERQNDLEAEHEQAGAEAVGGKGSAWSPEDHPRSSDTGKFIDA